MFSFSRANPATASASNGDASLPDGSRLPGAAHTTAAPAYIYTNDHHHPYPYPDRYHGS